MWRTRLTLTLTPPTSHRNRREAAAEFLRGNEEQLRIKAERKAEEERAALRMMHEMNERLRIQEEEHFANLEAMKAKQRRQEELGNAVGPYKRYIDDAIIERNFAQREAALAAREEADKADMLRKREKLRADLAKQLEARAAAAAGRTPLPAHLFCMHICFACVWLGPATPQQNTACLSPPGAAHNSIHFRRSGRLRRGRRSARARWTT